MSRSSTVPWKILPIITVLRLTPVRPRKPQDKSLVENQVKVIYTRSLVKTYHKGGLIATHPRHLKKGGYTTRKEHLCSHHKYYKERSPTYYLQRGYNHSEELYRYMEALFKQDKYPEPLKKNQ